MIRNVGLAREILEQIEAHPEMHDQEFVERETACGTTRCIAGWALYLRGWGPMKTEQAAAELLGITCDRADSQSWLGTDADALFYEFDNDRAVRKLRAFAEGRDDWAAVL